MSALIVRETCSQCRRGPRDNFERVQIAAAGKCMRPRCAPPILPEDYPPPRWLPRHEPEGGSR